MLASEPDVSRLVAGSVDIDDLPLIAGQPLVASHLAVAVARPRTYRWQARMRCCS